MNILLLADGDLHNEGRAVINDSRSTHLLDVVGVDCGSTVRCGVLNDRLGSATVTAIEPGQPFSSIQLDVQLHSDPPPASAIKLICALPRPKMVRRIVRTCAELGVKQLIFVNSFRVEKSYWQSPAVSKPKLHQYCLEGLAQSGDTVLPAIAMEPAFKPFVEDRLPGLLEQHCGILADPYQQTMDLRSVPSDRGIWAAIGPEGGFIPYEVQKLTDAGMNVVSLGPRIMRCDTVVPYLLATLAG